MSVTLLTALLLQVTAMLLLRHRLGKLWLRRPVTMLVLAAVVYQGLSAVLQTFPSVRAWDASLIGIQQGFINEAALVLSAGMLALVAAYLLTRPERSMAAAGEDGIRAVARVLDWRLLAAACTPLAILTYRGQGYNSGTAMGAGAPLATDFADMFFILLVALTAYGFVLRNGRQWFLPTLISQSLLLAAAGERTPVIIDAVVLIVLLAQSGLRPSAWQLRTAAALTVVAVLAITGERAAQGRDLFHADSGLATRAEALGGGISHARSGQAGPGLIAQAGARLDGNSFAGGILQSVSLGQPRLSPVYIPESLLIDVPSVIWPSKLAHSAIMNPPLMEMDYFGLRQINFLPGFSGFYAGFLSPAWLVLFLALLGALCGIGERRLFARFTPARLVLLASALIAVLGYEQGLPSMLANFRSGIVLAVVVKLAEVVLSRRARKSLNKPAPAH